MKPEEPLARYLIKSGDFSRQHKAVKPRAFVPFPHSVLSTFRIGGLSFEDVIEVGCEHVANPQGKSLYGFAQVRVDDFIAEGLAIDPDDSPPRHVSIKGWPTDKNHQVAIAQELAARAKLCLRE